MMRMAIAENESISNNATGEFIRLFPSMLPATSASLNERLTFLKNNINVYEQKPIILAAIKRATLVRDFILMKGAESFGDNSLQPYRPKNNDEIIASIHQIPLSMTDKCFPMSNHACWSVWHFAPFRSVWIHSL